MAAKSAYGPNPHAGIDANADHGWGGYQWPDGVPSGLLATATYRGANSTASCLCRRELVPLFELVWEIADKKHGYTVFGRPNPSGEPTWGPWGYENRPIGGTRVASNHSKGKAFDANAPRNPQSYTFQSDMPPAMVADFESCGFYWGGRYEGVKYDAMHFEYAFSPADVAGHIARARAILGRTPETPAKPTQPARPSLEGLTMIVRRDEQGVDYMWTDTYGPASYAEIIPSKGDYDLLYAAGSVDKPWGEATKLDRATIRWQMQKIQASGGVIGQGGAIPELDPKA